MAILVALIASPVIYVLSILVIVFFLTFYPKGDFSTEIWMSKPYERYKLTGDLIDRNIIIGLDRNELIKILGKEALYSHDSSHISYEVGHIPGLFNIEPSFLEIKLENGKVVSVCQVEG